MGLKLKEQSKEVLHLEHSFIGADIWAFRKVDQKYLQGFEVWCWKRLEKISWTDRVTNKEVF
jgi:hypothetical protein